MKTILNNMAALLTFAALLFFSSCEENYLKYDATYNGIYFTKDSTSYSFGVTPIETRTHLYKIPVAIMGAKSKEKRYIAYEICPELTKASEGVQYSIGEVCILPDSISGYIPVTINRDNLEGSFQTKYTRYELCIKLLPNENFVPTLDSVHQVHMFRFDNSVEQPEWYNDKGEKIWSKEKLGEWHPLKLIKMVEFFHELEAIKPETYKKMVAEYGENLEHIKNGDPERYKGTFDKYIYSKMYDYFSDPANKETIMSEFDNFFDENGNHDFPNPYEK